MTGMSSAQDLFKLMLRDEVAPALRASGLKGSGQRFELPSESHWALLGFQKSAWSDRQRLTFTVNLTVVARSVWTNGRRRWSQLPEQPGPNWALPPMMESAFDTGYWHARIGELMPGNLDRWWEVNATPDSGAVAAEVVEAIVEYALPEMRERLL
jgi:hypothetical protein